MVVLVRWIGWDLELDRRERAFEMMGKEPIDGWSESFTLNDGKKSSGLKFYKFDHYGLTV